MQISWQGVMMGGEPISHNKPETALQGLTVSSVNGHKYIKIYTIHYGNVIHDII